MIKVILFATIFVPLVSIEGSQSNSMDSVVLEKKKRSTPRGYYGYPVLPFGEPLTILAGLAFIAYIIQAFHALYFQNHGLGGGVLNNVLPGKSRDFLSNMTPQGKVSDKKLTFLEDLKRLIGSEEFNKTSFHCVESDTPKKCLDGPCILGVDEAGRGPVLGPMVYAVCYCSVKQIEIIKAIGCTDSKALTEEKREEIFGLINSNNDYIGWGADIISPNYISTKMLKRTKCSLNEIAQDSTIKLIASALKKNINISEIYVDTIGPPEKYQVKLSKLFPKCKIMVEKKADSLYPIVGAASICAKVIRDTVVQNWQFPELINIKNKEFGTGYPGDPKSKQFLLENRDEIFGFPNFVRFSWSTAEKLMEEITQVEWDEESDIKESVNTDISKFFFNLGSSGELKHKTNGRFFKERSLNSVDQF